MRKVREILRLRWGLGLSQREVARSVVASPATVFECTRRAAQAGLSWPLPDDLDDARLEARLYPPRPGSRTPRAAPDFGLIHRELRRKGVTLQLLWQEYVESHPDEGYGYSQFCDLFRRYRRKLDVVLRQDHRAGEKMFVDYSGDGIDIVNPQTGEVTRAELFVAALGASSFTYAEATASQKVHDWIQSHVRAFEFFGGVAEVTVPDQLRSAVTRPCRYEPELQRTYEEMARHYSTVVIPARPRKPRDKAKAEAAVLVAQRWILAVLRNHTFHSIADANREIRRCLAVLNARKFQKLDVSREDLYRSLDRPALKPLPATRYEYAEWVRARVNIDYHVEIDKHYYSVPYSLVHEQVEARVAATTVEIVRKGRRVASHVRSYEVGKHSTIPEHMPKAHQKHLEWTPSRLIEWGRKNGECTAQVIEKILESRPHPEQGYRACLGLLRLSKQYLPGRLEAACCRALHFGTHSYQSVKSILQSGLDQETLPDDKPTPRSNPSTHKNVRGPDYYQ